VNLTTIAQSCASNACPTIYTDDDRILVQGDVVDRSAHGLEVPESESVVAIPAALILEAAERLRERGA
jgi:hypothetical protein